MDISLVSAVLLLAVVGAAPDKAAVVPYESPAEVAAQGRIDQLVFARLKKLGIKPAAVCSDAVFVRRVYLDVIGTLPTAKEARAFLEDQDPNKRRLLIDRLLERDEFADYWALKWGDLLRVKAEFPINLWPNAVQAYSRWIRTSIKENKPYDRFVRELLTANGSNFRVPPVNFYRAVQAKEPPVIAQSVALTFLGQRADKWPKERLAGMAGFFTQIGFKATGEWKEEIVFYDPTKPLPDVAVFPDGTKARLTADRDPREVFADWFVSPGNPEFARNIANRVWSWLLGRGIVHEPDDIRPDNPPSNPELLAYLEKQVVADRYDLKRLYREILNSKTYQLSSIPADDDPRGEANFSHYALRRLEAEVLIDALNQITGTTEKYSSPIPEPFTYIPESNRSIALADGSITSPFLETFGRPSRDTGLESERNNRTTAAQRLHLLNSSHIQRKIEQSPRLQAVLAGNLSKKAKGAKGAAKVSSQDSAKGIVRDIYLTILSRYPTDDELQILRAYADTGSKGRELLVDLSWALINSSEFLYRH